VRLHPDTRTRLLIDVNIDVDPAGTTPELAIDGDWYPATWQGTASQRNVSVNGVTITRWTQTARTDGYFCGPTAAPAGAVVLAAGRHPTKTRIADLVNESTPIDVTP